MNRAAWKANSYQFLLAVMFTGALADLLPVSAAKYVVTDLGTLGGDYSRATDLNEPGQVIGVSRTADGRERAFLWQNGVMTSLGTLGGTNSYAAAINETGQIVGWAENQDGGIRACLFGTTNVDLDVARIPNSYAADINDRGEIVGWFEDQEDRAFVWHPTVRNLSLWNGYALRGRAIAINNDALIGGWTSDVAWYWRRSDAATFWNGLRGTPTRIGGPDSYVAVSRRRLHAGQRPAPLPSRAAAHAGGTRRAP